MIVDVATGYLDCCPTDARNADITEVLLNFFMSGARPKRFYSDNEKGFVTAAKNMKWPHDSSKPHDRQANGLIESYVGIVKNGA